MVFEILCKGLHRTKSVFFVLLALLCPLFSLSQNTSNKGTDFWIGYMGHIDGTGSAMKLYITSDVTTTGTVSIPGQSWSQGFSVTANAVTVLSIPPATAYVGCSDCKQARAIRLVSAAPVVVYSHIHANARSDATLVLPTATLGREYYAMSFTQLSSGTSRYNQFMVVGVEDSTNVQITPIANSLSNTKIAGQSFTVTLNQGEVYQYQSTSDISGSHIQSVAGSSGGCKRIAVFSGSSFTALGCSSASSGDNLYQQLYPASTWGKEFITVPMKTRTGGDYFRVLAGTDNTLVYVNNAYVTTLNKGNYHEFLSSTANYVKATQPVQMAQYQRTQNCDNVTGDPSMTILSPVEQRLNDITLYSSPYQNITNHHINIVIQAKDTGSFRLDGNRVSWSFVSSKPTYMYSQTTVSAGNHTLNADSGFNAVAYGFGNVESYGYAAGASIKNLTHFISTAQGAVCLGEATKFIANTTYTPSKYKWYLQDTLYSDSASPVITFDSLGTYKMALVTIKSNQNDCESQDSSTLTISVYNQPVAKFSIPKVCLNDTVKLRDSSTIASGPSYINKWKWEYGDGTVSTLQNVNKRYDSAYNFKVKLIVGTNHGCFDTLVKQLPVYPMPKPKFGFANVCYQDTARFSDSTTIDSSAITDYLWSFGDGAISNLQHPVHYYPFADTFTVKLKAVTEYGCSDSAYDSIVIFPRPIAQIATASVCHKDTIGLGDITLTTTDYITQRQWWTGPYYIDTAAQLSYPASDTGLHSFYLWVDNNFGCTDTATTVVDVFSVPRAAFTVVDICYTDSARFTNQSVIDEGTLTYRWEFGDGNQSTQQQPKHKYAIAGGYNPLVIVTSEKGCADTASKTLNAFDMPNVDFGLKDVCVYDSAVLLNKTTYSYGYTSARLWRLGDGAVDTSVKPVHKYASYGSYTLSLKETVAGVCTDSVQKTLSIYPKPQTDFSFTDRCVREAVNFTDNSTINIGKIVRYTWDIDGKPDTGKVVTQTWFFEGAKNVQLVTESDFGCRDTLVKTVTIHPAAVVKFTASENCLRDTTRFTNTSTLTKGNINTLVWDFNDGSGAMGTQTGHVYSSWGNYNVGLVATSDKGCIDSARQSVRVNPLPVSKMVAVDTAGCQPLVVNFYDSSQIAEGSIVKWLWQFDGKRKDTLKNTLFTYNQYGSYSPTLKVTTDKGCTHDTVCTNYITVHQLPVAGFVPTPDSVSFFTPFITYNNQATADVVFWDWDLGDGSISNDESPVHEYADTGRFFIRQIVTNQNGCLDTAYGRVFISPDYTFFIPTAFTPDEGGLNPVFGPEGIFKGIIAYEMRIFNRWGEKVFETDTLLKPWDGTYRDKLAIEDVYVYEITIMDYFKTKKHFRGTVLLIR